MIICYNVKVVLLIKWNKVKVEFVFYTLFKFKHVFYSALFHQELAVQFDRSVGFGCKWPQ